MYDWWGEYEPDTLATFVYPGLRFTFRRYKTGESRLYSIELLDRTVRLPGGIVIGATTRSHLVDSLGLPDHDYNDGERTLTKSGSTMLAGSNSGMGDTVVFEYEDVADVEVRVGLSMVRDTVCGVGWGYNLN